MNFIPPYREIDELMFYAILFLWLIMGVIGAATTAIKYLNKRFLDNTIYSNHYQFWLTSILFLASISLVADFILNHSFMSWWHLIVIFAPTLIAITLGPASFQNKNNTSLIGILIFFYLIMFVIFLQYQTSPDLWQRFMMFIAILGITTIVIFKTDSSDKPRLLVFQRRLYNCSKYFLFSISTSLFFVLIIIAVLSTKNLISTF